MRLTVERALEMPFCHPVIEEALQDALLELNAELNQPRKRTRFAVFKGRRVIRASAETGPGRTDSEPLAHGSSRTAGLAKSVGVAKETGFGTAALQ